MKRRILFALLLGVIATSTVQGHRHNPGALPEALTASLSANKFDEGGNLFAANGDLLLSSEFRRVTGRDHVTKALGDEYKGWTIDLGEVHFWIAGEKTDMANIAFVNWIYTVKKGDSVRKELFVAIARKKGSGDPPGETFNDQDWLFVTVRRMELPLP